MIFGRGRSGTSGRDLRDGRRDRCGFDRSAYESRTCQKRKNREKGDIDIQQHPYKTYEERRAQAREGRGIAAWLSSLHLVMEVSAISSLPASRRQQNQPRENARDIGEVI